MIEWIVSSCVLIAALLLLRLVFRNRISKRLQYALWVLVLLRLLIPGSVVQSAASIGNLISGLTEKPVVQAASGTMRPEEMYNTAVEEILSSHNYSKDIYSKLPENKQEDILQAYHPEIQQRVDTYTKAYDTARVLNILWLTGVAVMGLCLLSSNLLFAVNLRRSRTAFRADSPLRVYTADVSTPCLFGLFRPTIYLPDTAFRDGTLIYIMAHEQTHYRHLDHIWAFCRCICLALHWYNPLVWLAVKVSRIDSELACDEGTLAKLGESSRESYGRTLIEMSCAKPSAQDYLLTATTMTGDKKSLYQRIESIAKKPRFMLTAVIALAVISLVIVGCTFTGTKNGTAGSTIDTTMSPETTSPLTSTPPTTAPTEATQPAGTTIPAETQPPTFPMGHMGNQTDGALRSLSLNMGSFCESYLFGGNILLCIPQDGVYQIRSLEDGSVLATVTDNNLANTVTVTDNQIIYYSIITQKIIFRDLHLEITKTLDFSLNDSVAEMLFTHDGKKAYYCTDAHTVVELNLDTFRERVIPVNGPQIWTLSGLYFDDSVLGFWGKENGDDYYGFIRLDTGTYLGKDTAITKLQNWDSNYYLCRARQDAAERLVVLDGSHRYMVPKNHGKQSCYSTVLPQLNSFFTLSYDYDNPVVILDLYDLNSKLRTASLTVDIGGEYGSSAMVFADPSGEYIWLCLKVGGDFSFQNYNMVLYRWDFRANAVEDTAVYGYGE